MTADELKFVKQVREEYLHVVDALEADRPPSRQDQARLETKKELEELKRLRGEGVNNDATDDDTRVNWTAVEPPGPVGKLSPQNGNNMFEKSENFWNSEENKVLRTPSDSKCVRFNENSAAETTSFSPSNNENKLPINTIGLENKLPINTISLENKKILSDTKKDENLISPLIENVEQQPEKIRLARKSGI